MLRRSKIKSMAGWLLGRSQQSLMIFSRLHLIRCRGDLKNERVKSEYERGYGVLLDFYRKHL